MISSIKFPLILFLAMCFFISTSRAADTRPNIIFILADDLRLDEVAKLPRINELLMQKGTSFQRYFTPNALCCPSRSSTLRGQFSHNTGIWTNFKPSGGGFQNFTQRRLDSETIAVWLQRAGYETALIGKYLNGYGKSLNGQLTGTYIPPGWSKWFAFVEGNGAPQNADYSGYNYDINDDGVLKRFGSSVQDYSTDVLANQAQQFIQNVGGNDTRKPFFLYLTPTAPHRGLPLARRHEPNPFAEYEPEFGPSFNEADVSDKPDWVQNLPVLSKTQVERVVDDARRRLGTMLAVEDMLVDILAALEATGQQDNTFIFLASDNGFHFGEHRLTTKATVYDTAVRVPLIVQGPGVVAGREVEHMVYNHDLPATFAAIAGATVPAFLDGKSITPLFGATPPAVRPWRSSVLLEHREHRTSGFTQPDVFSIRTITHRYAEYVNAADRCELYVISPGADPGEMENRCNDPALAEVQENLATRLQSLKTCRAETCRELEEAPFGTSRRQSDRRR